MITIVQKRRKPFTGQFLPVNAKSMSTPANKEFGVRVFMYNSKPYVNKMTILMELLFWTQLSPQCGHCCENNNICWLEGAKTVSSALLATNRSLAYASLPITFGSQARLGDCNCVCRDSFEVAATKQCISITVTLLRSEAEQQWERSDQVVH